MKHAPPIIRQINKYKHNRYKMVHKRHNTRDTYLPLILEPQQLQTQISSIDFGSGNESTTKRCLWC